MAPSTIIAGLAVFFFLPWTSLAASPKAVSLNFSKQKQRREAPRTVRRDDGLSLTLDNGRVGLYVDFAVGTPPQVIRAQIDTGSSDTWLPNGAKGQPYGCKSASQHILSIHLL